MKKLLLTLVALFIVTFAASVNTHAQTRITFARGATSKIVSGQLDGFKGKRVYLIRVRAGQTLRTEQIGSIHPITIEVLDPNGDIAADSDASCNNRKQVENTLAGTFKLIVTECRKADRWRGTFKFRVWVK
jgi:hypothetical protein